MKEFLEKYNLYEEFLLLKDYSLGNQFYTDKADFRGKNFDYYCPVEGLTRPFELFIPDYINKPIVHSPTRREKSISDDKFINEKLNYTFWIAAKCKSCEKHNVHFLLNVYSNNPISNIIDNFNNIRYEERNSYDFPNTNIYIQKVGIYPEKKIIIEKAISQHFDKETNNWLYKAKSLVNSNFGIGAFAYLRRIIEKELIKIIGEIKLLPDINSVEIGKLLEEYEKNPKTYTIYENLYKYLPESLKDLGNNPIELLYKQTSEGLHSLSELDCLTRAKSIIILLEFTIQKINEANSDIKSVKDAIKKLK